MKVWAVVYSNYEPPETDSLWTTEAEAQKRRNELNSVSRTGMWKVQAWTVDEVWKPET